MYKLLILALALSLGSALRLPARVDAQLATRRGALIQAAGAVASLTTAVAASAKPSELATAGLSKDELYAAARARKEAEGIAALPINKMKAAKGNLAAASTLIDAGEWTELRDLIYATTGDNLSRLEKEGKFSSTKVRELTVKLRKELYTVDKFAYSQQSFPGSEVFAGYCAEGVVPRDSGSGCKVKPVVDKAPLVAKVKDALATYDDLIKACEA